MNIADAQYLRFSMFRPRLDFRRYATILAIVYLGTKSREMRDSAELCEGDWVLRWRELELRSHSCGLI